LQQRMIYKIGSHLIRFHTIFERKASSSALHELLALECLHVGSG
jgi:hypothetical protein